MNFKLKILIISLICSIFISCGNKVEITSHIVHPSYIWKVSKFRSCCGHSFGNESSRSMKHYFTPISSLPANNTTLPIYAPFDGNLVEITDEEQRLVCYGDARRGKSIKIVPRANPNQFIRIFHTNPTVSAGKVKAGQQIAFADLRSCNHANPTLISNTPDPFDYTFEIFYGQYLSAFEGMSAELLSSWSSYGVTLSNVIISSGVRDANPCSPMGGSQCDSDTISLNGQSRNR